VRIIEHADVRRMLLAQKAYAEGGLALVLYCAKLVDDKATSDPEEAREAAALLEILTPIAKSWPSEWCLEANSLAIQVHGGYGYTRDYPVEQLWRDNRLNMIHEGTHGIQALDLLGRKVRMDGGSALAVLAGRIAGTVDRASGVPQFATRARELADAMNAVRNAVDEAWKAADPELALANATPFMQAFGHTVIAWLWLDAGLAAHAAMESGGSSIGKDHLSGKLHCVSYFFDYELPKTSGWLRPVATRSAACFAMQDESFNP
jgi:butyryl-CoA dehydrogenase